MNACESYEIHISALLDGEATQADTLVVLDHLPHCDSCREFYRQARELQDVVDVSPLVPGATMATELRARELGIAFLLQEASAEDLDDDATPARPIPVASMERAPRWVWGLAASLLVALGFGLGSVGGGASAAGESLPAGVLQVVIGADAGHMTDERFVALAMELLRSDRRYHHKMSAVLRAVQGGRVTEDGAGEVASWTDESSFSIRSEEGGMGGPGERLRLSPMQDTY